MARQQVGTLFSRLSALAVKPDLSSKDVIEASGKLAAEGLVTPQQLATEFSGMPQGGDALREWVNGHLANTTDTQQKIEAAYGHLVSQNLGNRTQYVRENPFRGAVAPAGGSAATMTQGLTPGEQVQPQHVVSPTGQPGMVTTSEFAKSRGIILPGTESAPGAAPAGAPGIPAPAPGKVSMQAPASSSMPT